MTALKYCWKCEALYNEWDLYDTNLNLCVYCAVDDGLVTEAYEPSEP